MTGTGREAMPQGAGLRGGAPTGDVVDAHSHFYPAWYVDLLKERTEIPRIVQDGEVVRFVMFPGERGRPIDAEYWDLERKLAFMDRTGITRTLLSLGNPWLDPFPGADEVDITRLANRFFAGLEEETGGRILGMGVLPPSDIAAAAAVVSEVAGAAGLYGIITGTRICGRPLDDPALDPLWGALEATGVPTLIHPHYAVGGDQLDGYGHAFPVAMGFTFETTIAVARLVFGGVLRRFPGLTLVASHGGGTIPFLAGRLDAAWKSDPSTHDRLPYLPSRDLRRLHYDAVLFHAGALQATAELVGTNRMPWGTDHPFSVADPETSLEAVRTGLDEAGRRGVLTGSAEEIFLRKRGAGMGDRWLWVGRGQPGGGVSAGRTNRGPALSRPVPPGSAAWSQGCDNGRRS